MKVLIVEDNQRMRQEVKFCLREVANEIGECEDGAEALDAYTALQPDWVLMDLEMRYVDGITASRQILAAFPTARICILTNHNDELLREAAQQAGTRKLVLKEDLNQLANILCELSTQEQK
ncbi:MAG: response regulator transcription factor [Blastocatellia bacterium]|nr:response regulator transcription factor [Blastocatellia bacterium]